MNKKKIIVVIIICLFGVFLITNKYYYKDNVNKEQPNNIKNDKINIIRSEIQILVLIRFILLSGYQAKKIDIIVGIIKTTHSQICVTQLSIILFHIIRPQSYIIEVFIL